jgi:hypothetical protein
MVVRMKPDGSFGPGIRNLAMTPAMKPMMMVQMIDINVPFGCYQAQASLTAQGNFPFPRRLQSGLPLLA